MILFALVAALLIAAAGLGAQLIGAAARNGALKPTP